MEQQKGIRFSEERKLNMVKINSYVLGIGINDYKHFPKLYNAKKDIQDIKSLLIEKYNFEDSNFKILIDKDATRKNIILAINEYRKILKKEDRLLIYYSGHGYFDGHLGFWVPQEAEKDDISGLISNGEVREIIKHINAKHILLISDSCFSGSLLVRDAISEVSNAFEEWESKTSRWVFSSGKGLVSDGEPGKNSPFTRQFLELLKVNEYPRLNIVYIADSIIKNIRFNYEQQPECLPFFQTGHDGGQFIFYLKKTTTNIENDLVQDTTKIEEKNIQDLVKMKFSSENYDGVFTIYVDDKYVCSLGRYETKEIGIVKGRHNIYATYRYEYASTEYGGIDRIVNCESSIITVNLNDDNHHIIFKTRSRYSWLGLFYDGEYLGYRYEINNRVVST